MRRSEYSYMPLRAAIYTRISNDPRLTGLGIERQLEDCMELCDRNGWKVVAVYPENDTSAYSGKRRPQYEKLCQSIKDRDIDIVVAWHTDRLHRRLLELVEYTNLVRDGERMVVQTHTVKAGDIDLSTPSGIMIAHIKGAVDESYVSEAREKNLRGRRQIAEKGGRHKVARVYGWEDDGIALRESEAMIVREMASRLISGETGTSIAADLNARKIPTIRGGGIWHGITISKMASRASNAAIREHRGELHYNGQWQPIMSVETWERVKLALDSRQSLQFKRGAGRKYLLTGFAFCGKCGSKLSATVGSGKAKSSYRCHRTRSHDRSIQGCGQVSRHIAPLETLVSEAILMRLNSPGMMKALTDHKDDRTAVTELLSKRDEQQSRIDNLITGYVTGRLSLTEQQFNKAKIAAQDELDAINKQLGQLTSNQVLANIDLTVSLADMWEHASISWKRNLVELLIERVEVMPYQKKAKVVRYKSWRFDPELIQIRWRV